MLVFFKHGFISVVQHRDKPKRVLVRARRRRDLYAVVQVWTESFGKRSRPPKIQVDSKTDNLYYLNMDKAEFSKVVMSLANQVNYDNFENSLEDDSLLAFTTGTWNASQDYLSADRYDLERTYNQQHEGIYGL